MTIFVRADESGVFVPVHNDFFIFAGLIFLDAQEMELTSRRYLSMEKKLRKKKEYKTLPELKATLLNHGDRRTLFRVTESCSRFCVIVKLSHLDSKSVFADKKSKQRYLDYAFKRGLKHAITCMAERGSIFYEDPAQFSILLDERTNASNGQYDLEESIYREMREGKSEISIQELFLRLCRILRKSQSNMAIQSMSLFSDVLMYWQIGYCMNAGMEAWRISRTQIYSYSDCLIHIDDVIAMESFYCPSL